MFGVTMFRPTVFVLFIFWIETAISELAPFTNSCIDVISSNIISNQSEKVEKVSDSQHLIWKHRKILVVKKFVSLALRVFHKK